MDNTTRVNVLLVEDEPVDACLDREALTGINEPRFTVVWVSELYEGLAHLAGNPVDVVLLDLTLPNSHGYDAFERLHACASQIPIFILTGLVYETLALKVIRHGAQDYLEKGNVDRLYVASVGRGKLNRHYMPT